MKPVIFFSHSLSTRPYARYLAISIAGFAGLAGPACRGETLSWQGAVVETVAHNSELRSASDTLQSAIYTKQASYGGFFPQLDGSFGFSRGVQDFGTPAALALPGSSIFNGNAPTNSFTFTLSATQNIFAGLADEAKVHQAAANADLAEATLGTTRARLSYELKSAFANLLFAQQSVDLQFEIIRRRQENLRLVNLRFQSGRENRGSLMLSQAYLDDAKYHALQARGSLEVARVQLARVLGRDNSADISILVDPPLEDPPDSPTLRTIVQRSPDHSRAQAQDAVADAGVSLARAGFMPTLGANASIGRSGTDWFPADRVWSVGVTLSVPLFHGGRDYFGFRSAVASAAAARATLANTDRQTLTTLKQNYQGYIEAREKLSVDLSYRAAATKRAEIARGKYNNGLLTFDEWDLIENDLITRETSALTSRRDRSVAEAAWQQAQGRGVFP